MADRSHNIPRYEVHSSEVVELEVRLGVMGLAKVVAIQPGLETPDTYFNAVGNKNNTTILPLYKVADDEASLFALVTNTNDSDGKERLEQAAEDMKSLVNAWHDPQAALQILYRPGET